jgi:hypothetical protein
MSEEKEISPASFYMFNEFLQTQTPLQLARYIIKNINVGVLKKILPRDHPLISLLISRPEKEVYFSYLRGLPRQELIDIILLSGMAERGTDIRQFVESARQKYRLQEAKKPTEELISRIRKSAVERKDRSILFNFLLSPGAIIDLLVVPQGDVRAVPIPMPIGIKGQILGVSEDYSLINIELPPYKQYEFLPRFIQLQKSDRDYTWVYNDDSGKYQILLDLNKNVQ